MESSLRLGKLFGIEIGINSTWLIIFGLVTFSLATGYYPDAGPDLSVATYWVIGAISAVLLFVSVLIHELAHSLVARARGMDVGFIVLYLFGGVSNLEEEPPSPGTEFLVTIVGPLSSIVLGGVFLALYEVMSGTSDVVTVMLDYLAVINILLALFNLIPGYPLDGGRLLHAAIWKMSDNRARATQIASGVGVLVSITFIAGGLVIAFTTPRLLNGLWLAFIGWFLLQASGVRFRRASERLEA
jgi:Zn-dependent protease